MMCAGAPRLLVLPRVLAMPRVRDALKMPDEFSDAA